MQHTARHLLGSGALGTVVMLRNDSRGYDRNVVAPVDLPRVQHVLAGTGMSLQLPTCKWLTHSLRVSRAHRHALGKVQCCGPPHLDLPPLPTGVGCLRPRRLPIFPCVHVTGLLPHGW